MASAASSGARVATAVTATGVVLGLEGGFGLEDIFPNGVDR